MEATGNRQPAAPNGCRNGTAAATASQLHDAIKKGSVKTVRQLLEEGVDVNSKVEGGWTPLHSAVQAEQEEIVNLLLEQGADPHARKDNGATPFIIAGIVGNVNLLELFLSKGSEINEKDNNGFTAFMEAAWYGKEKALKFLYENFSDEKEMDVNLGRMVSAQQRQVYKGGETALMDAARNGHLSAVKTLVKEMRASVHACDNFGRNALIHALRLPLKKNTILRQNKNIEPIVSFLLDCGADVTGRDENGKTSLILAAERQSQDLVELLLKTGKVDINAMGNDGKTALKIAVEHDHEEIAKLLCENGVRADSTDIFAAKENYNNEMVALLLKYGATATNNQPPKEWAPTSKRWGEQLWCLHSINSPQIGKLNIIFDEYYRIESTSEGGIYLGFHAGKEVAVKRFLLGSDKAERESMCLSHCHSNRHMVKLFGTETHGNCQLFCLSLCESNLEDHLSKSAQAVNNRDILKTLLEAVRDLHSLELGHGDLHPRNILIDFDKSSSFAEGQRELIIKEDLESIGAVHARSFGGRGLPSARSIVRKLLCPVGVGDETELHRWNNALGRLVLYVVTRGEVPFDRPDGEDVAARCPTDLQGHLEIEDLIRSLVSPHGGNSVQLGDLLHHPFFWTHESRFEFLVDVGNNPDIEKYNAGSQIVKALNCNKATTEKHFYQWTKKIDQAVLENMKKKRHYKDTVTDLLRFIRNVGAHYGAKPQWFKEIIQNPSQYFVDRFPDLTFYVYEHLCRVDRAFLKKVLHHILKGYNPS
ncbi:2-5A-dependent ribonuclease-like isoform X2 [Mauremys mutica]|uniref:2-5A-dependent ribonuclease-like isoform X2 n=1 Tax=Mauremys mutica TaxID=74926 RepID=UPI001D160E54|nr:2-5A-dependent ribonuclease-like isoform X2 [Mauremys mutica]